MGAITFDNAYGNDSDPDAAFDQAHNGALREHGDGGYTGTIAEKNSFVIVSDRLMTPKEAEAFANELLDSGDERITNADAPAGAIPIRRTDAPPSQTVPDCWLFFGWASW